MNSHSSKLKAVAAAALLTVSASAFAVSSVTTDLGMISPLAPKSFGGGSVPGGFFDYFKFELPVNGGSAYSVANFSPSFLGGSFNLLFSSLTLFKNPDGIIGTGDDVAVATSSSLGNAELTLNYAQSVGGKMYLTVVGQTTGTNGGIYTGAINVSPIPEPESYAMFLAGLGIMGAIVMRRKKTN